MEYKYAGIILSKKDVGETDRLYNIYTLENGKIKALAKGIRKANAKLAGFLENYILADITVVKNQGIGKITSSIIENNFSRIRSDVDVIISLSKNINRLEKLTEWDSPDAQIFNLLKVYLETLDSIVGKPEKIEIINLGFIFKLYDSLGYKLNVQNCASCSEKLKIDKNYFSAEQGGVICAECYEKMLHSENSVMGQDNKRSNVKISDNAIKLLRLFFNNDIKSLPKIKITGKEIRELNHIAEDFFHWIAK